MKSQILLANKTLVNLEALKSTLKECSDVSAAYLFGSAAEGNKEVNDLDILALLCRKSKKDEVYINLINKLSRTLNLPEHCIDLLFFDIEEVDPSVLTKAVNEGILLKNDDREYLSQTIDNASRYLLDNEAMRIRGKRLRQERLEVFCET
ncbi:nucleotidyltransferase domain-containing protein [candidate division KSB1 bacterium]|nr:nucleotidyltransferase domain-containing protein [candidate division KSB1 bacterium]